MLSHEICCSTIMCLTKVNIARGGDVFTSLYKKKKVLHCFVFPSQFIEIENLMKCSSVVGIRYSTLSLRGTVPKPLDAYKQRVEYFNKKIKAVMPCHISRHIWTIWKSLCQLRSIKLKNIFFLSPPPPSLHPPANLLARFGPRVIMDFHLLRWPIFMLPVPSCSVATMELRPPLQLCLHILLEVFSNFWCVVLYPQLSIFLAHLCGPRDQNMN